MKDTKKKHKYKVKYIFILFLVLINLIFFVSIFGRYVVNGVKPFFGRTKEFYFYSDKLGEKNPSYQIENWSGVDDYVITINMHGYQNNLLTNSYDIDYEISYIASDNIICQLSANKGTINTDTNSSSFNLTITPNVQLETGDNVFVEITARATSPYEKTIKGRFTLIVGKEKLSYQVDDVENRPYLDVNITNTLSYYTVREAFGSYGVGTQITREVYESLTTEEKSKCYSKIVTLEFKPEEILLDMTSNSYANAIETKTVVKNGHTYINSITFSIDALSSQRIRFYKVDETKNYTYPNSNNIEVVKITSI